MLSGELYDASDVELTLERKEAREILRKLNYDNFSNNNSNLIQILLPNASKNVFIQPPFYCDYGYNIYSGEYVFLNFNCIFLDVAPIIIGPNTLIGPNVQIYTASHPTDAEERRTLLEFGKPISIGEDCWIGGSAIILPGVTIGDRCII